MLFDFPKNINDCFKDGHLDPVAFSLFSAMCLDEDEHKVTDNTENDYYGVDELEADEVDEDELDDYDDEYELETDEFGEDELEDYDDEDEFKDDDFGEDELGNDDFF